MDTILTDEEIDKALSSVDPTFWDVSTGATEAFARAIEQAVLQSPEIQALRKDAERWEKFLETFIDGGCRIDGVWFDDGRDLEKYIDATKEN